MFPYFLLLSTCCVLLLPYIFTLPSPNIFAGGCTPSGQLQSKSRVRSGDGSPLSPWYPDIGHSPLYTLAPLSAPRSGQGPDQQMHSRHTRADYLHSTFYLHSTSTFKLLRGWASAGDTRHAAAWLAMVLVCITNMNYWHSLEPHLMLFDFWQKIFIRLGYQSFLLLQNTHRSCYWSPGIAPIMV